MLPLASYYSLWLHCFSCCHIVYKVLLNPPFISSLSPSNNLSHSLWPLELNKVLPTSQGYHTWPDLVFLFSSVNHNSSYLRCSGGWWWWWWWWRNPPTFMLIWHLTQVHIWNTSSCQLNPCKIPPTPPSPGYTPPLFPNITFYHGYSLAQFDTWSHTVVCCYLTFYLYWSWPQVDKGQHHILYPVQLSKLHQF